MMRCKASGSAFQTFGAALDNWNSQADGAVAQMKAMASAAGQMADAMSRAGGTSLPTAQTAGASSGFWLPPGMEAETQRLNDALKTVGTTATDTGGKIKDAGTTGAAGIADADDKTSKFVVTWGTLSRVVMTQLIVRAMSQIRDALREAVEQSIEFQRRIAEVQTIAPQIGGGFAQLTSEVAEFAKQFNIPLKEATEGLYQTLSNQFTAMSQRTDIMTASMKLAKVGVMDFHDAILLDDRHLERLWPVERPGRVGGREVLHHDPIGSRARPGIGGRDGAGHAHRRRVGHRSGATQLRDGRTDDRRPGRPQGGHGPARGHDGAA